MSKEENKNWIVERTNVKISELRYCDFLSNIKTKASFKILLDDEHEYVACISLGTCLQVEGEELPVLRFAIKMQLWNELNEYENNDTYLIYLETATDDNFRSLYTEFLHFPEICIDCILHDVHNSGYFYSTDYDDIYTFSCMDGGVLDNAFGGKLLPYISTNPEVNRIFDDIERGFVSI